MRKVLVLQHVGCETLGSIENALSEAGIGAHYIRSFQGDPVPEQLGDFCGLIVMGGPMGVYEQDQFPYLRAEIKLIERTLKDEKPILGTCLGSQLLAATLGATVRPGKQKEIGWFPLTLSKEAQSGALWQGIPTSFHGFHWHGDIFDLPAGATNLASSSLTQQQAFRYGRNAYGFLFHMEVSDTMIREWVAAFSDELSRANFDGAEIIARSAELLPPLQSIGDTVYRRWANLL